MKMLLMQYTTEELIQILQDGYTIKVYPKSPKFVSEAWYCFFRYKEDRVEYKWINKEKKNTGEIWATLNTYSNGFEYIKRISMLKNYVKIIKKGDYEWL